MLLQGAASELNDCQVGNHLEVPQVPGTDRVAEVECNCADQQVRERNRAAELPGRGIHLRGKLGHLPGERFYRDRGEDGIQVLSPLPGLVAAWAR